MNRALPLTHAFNLRQVVPLMVATLLFVTLVPAVSAAAGKPTFDGPSRVPPAPDYASEAFSDPWDYANREDVLLDRNGPTIGLENQRLEHGRLVFDAVDNGYFWPLYLPVPGALSTVRDGPDNPIDASRYTHAAIRMYVDRSINPLLRWFTCEEYTDECSGGHAFNAQQGWRTYRFPLENTHGKQDWQGAIRGLRFDVNPAHVDIDWIRVYRPTGVTKVDADGGTLYWDADADPDNNTAGNPGWGRLDGDTFDRSAYPSGTYRFFTGNSPTDPTSPYSDPLHIDRAPLPVIDDPDEVGGEDYASTHRRDPWDMSGPGDAAELANVKDVSWSGGQLHATNASNDPFVRLPLVGGGIDTSRYHRLTVKMTYDGHFSLEDAPGGGTHGRAIWWRADTGDWTFHDSREILTFTDRDTYTIDLARSDVAEGGSRGWLGSTATYLRWDPNEDPGARRWRLDDVQLRADDEADERFDIRWHDPNGNVGADVELWADANRSGFNGVRIAQGITQTDGQNTHRWNVGDDLPGRWRIHAKVDNGTSVGRQYARGPLYVDPRLAGTDRDLTAIRMSRNAFPRGAPAAVVAYDRDFPDALAAAPLAAAAGGPVLLNPRDQLRAEVRAELERLGVRTVYLMGGPLAQSRQVEDELRSIPGVTVTRVSGADRYATGAAAATQAVELWEKQGVQDAGSHALIALGTAFPDALAAGPLAAAAQRPLLLISGDSVPDVTNRTLAELGTDTVTVIGGSGVIPDATMRRIGDADTDRSRIGGVNRYHTSKLVADAASQAGASPGTVIVALGEDFPDALAAGPAVAARGGVLLLTPPGGVADDTRIHLEGQRGKLGWLRVSGGVFAIHDAAVDGILEAAGLPR